MKVKLIVPTTAILASAICLLGLFLLMDRISSNVLNSTSAVAAPGETPSVTEVYPASAPNDLDAVTVITGSEFTAVPTVTLGGITLVDIGWVSTTSLTATVPWGLDPGVYTLTVINPDGAVGSLSSAFTVTQGIGVWNTGELFGGEINQIIINPITTTTMYARSGPIGFFRSQDGGASWSFHFSGMAVEEMAVSAVSPQRVYLYGSWQFYRSDDEGNSWIPLTTPFPITNTLGHECTTAIFPFPHPTYPDTVYAGACDPNGYSGLLKSADAGESWIEVMDGLTDTQVTALAFHPTNPLNMVLGTANGNVFFTYNGGESWTFASHAAGHVRTLAFDPHGSHEVWLSTWPGIADPCLTQKATNPELTEWITLTNDLDWPPGCNTLAFSPSISGTVYLGTSVGGYKTVDGGQTWDHFGPTEWIASFVEHPTTPNLIYAADVVRGIYVSSDGGVTWQLSNQGLTAMKPDELQAVSAQPDVVYSLFSRWEGVFRGRQGGTSWNFLPINYHAGSSMLVDPFNPQRIYLGGMWSVCISQDGGETWLLCNILDLPPQYTGYLFVPNTFEANPQQPGMLLAGGQFSYNNLYNLGGFYRSSTDGETWSYITLTEEISRVWDIAYDPISPTIVYASTDNGMLRSTDTGLTWARIGTEHPGMYWLQSIAVEPQTPYRIFVHGGDGQFYISSDKGLSWEVVAPKANWANPLTFVFAPTTPPTLYGAARDGLYRSTDGAQTWQRAAGDLGYAHVTALEAIAVDDRAVLYVGTAGGQLTPQGVVAASLGEGKLVNPGIYRYTEVISPPLLYLPLIVR